MAALAAGAAALAGGAYRVFDYNRNNFKYDREMRQKCEFKVLGFRSKQAALWREDIHDLIELTERRMDSYLIVNTLQLGMCVSLFTEGRLEAGTPQWLLRFYMLTLAAAFMYLLMSVWLSMHASVVAQTSGVRLLTQFVRLPIPTWSTIDKMRTYAASFENLGSNMLRIPFLKSPVANSSTWNMKTRGCSATSLPGGDANRGAAKDVETGQGSRATVMPDGSHGHARGDGHHQDADHFDVWGLEETGHDIVELQDALPGNRPHILMVREEALHWQCHDAFSRVAMSFGTNQLLFALTYYAMGYVSLQDGAPMPAWCAAGLMVSIAVTLVHLDFSLTTNELRCAIALVVTGPGCVAWTTLLTTVRSPNAARTANLCLPIAFMSHGLWLFYALKMLGTVKHPNGAWLPMKFRAVAYLDVFGWYAKFQKSSEKEVRRLERESPGSSKVRESKRRSILVIDEPGEESDDECIELSKAHRRPSLLDLSKEHQHGAPAQKKERPSSWAKNSRHSLPTISERDFERLSAFDLQTMDEARERLQYDFALFESQEMQNMLSEAQKVTISSLSRTFQNILVEESKIPRLPNRFEHSSSHDDDSDTEPRGSLDSTATATTRDASDKASWVRLEGHTDLGAEMPYFFNPQNGTIRSSSFHGVDDSVNAQNPWRRLTADERAPLKLSDLEEHVEEFRKRVEQRQSFENARAAAEASAQKLEDETRMESETVVADKGPNSLDCGLWVKSQSSREHTSRSPSKAVAPGHIDPFHSAATDGGILEPGKVPWDMLKKGSYLLILLWVSAMFLNFDSIGGPLAHGNRPLRAMDSTQARSDGKVDPAKVAAATFTGLISGDLESLAEGERIDVHWPRKAAFVPKTLSCDSSGGRLVVADDFGVYSGQMLQADGASESRKLLEVSYTSRFTRTPPCTAFEGQTLKDIGVVCAGADCHVIVLHANGRRLTECPLIATEEQTGSAVAAKGVATTTLLPRRADANSSYPQERRRHHKKAVKRRVRPAITWKISEQWLDANEERVQALALNNDCSVRPAAEGSADGHAFHPDGPGCLVVGTSTGRVVQLRQHVQRSNELVPEWSMQRRARSVTQGTLHVLPGGIVMTLRPKLGIVQALDIHRGDVLGQWGLPKGVSWTALCGGGINLYLLGRELQGKREVGLWRFRVPHVLQQRQNERQEI